MTEYLRLLVVFFAALNPAAIALGAAVAREASARRSWPLVAVAAAIAAALYGLAAGFAEDMIDFLEVEPETFRIAAGTVMLVVGAYAAWRARVAATMTDAPGWQAALFPLALPLLVGPAGVVAAISYGVDEGGGRTFLALLPVLALAALAMLAPAERYLAAFDAVARLTGALLVVVGAGLIVSGVRAI